MNLKLPIFLSSIGIIVALWPQGNLLYKIAFAIAILMASALPLMVKKKNIGWVSTGLVILFFGSFFSLTSMRKFEMKPDAEVRYADIEKLAKDFGTEKLDPYFKTWEEKCLAGSFDYCRIASYIPRVKREKRAEELLRIGCINRDFLSCYNFFFYDEFGPEDRKGAKEIILSQCSPDSTAEFKDICARVKTL